MSSLTFQLRVPVFDANVRAGHRHDEPSPAPDRVTLLAEMDVHGIGRALVYHAQTEILSPIEGNLELEHWLVEDDRLVAQWSVLPTAASMAQIESLHAAGRVCCLRLHDTTTAGLPFRPWAYAPLLTWIRDARLPLWIPLPEIEPDALMDTLRAFPELVTVLVGAHYTHTLLIRPLLAALPNAHLELSRYEPLGDIEALCAEFGAERLIYGSWYPRYAMGPMLFYLHHLDLNDTDLALICSGNLERILKGGRLDR